MIAIKKAKSNNKLFLIPGIIGLVISLGILMEARYLAANYPIAWSVSRMSYWYWAAHYAAIAVLVISLVLVFAYALAVFFSEPVEV